MNERELCDLELLLNGGFAPLTGYMNEADYDSVVGTMRLTTGELWPMPITLSISEDSRIVVGDMVTLKDNCGNPLALLRVEDRWEPNIEKECIGIYGCGARNREYIRV